MIAAEKGTCFLAPGSSFLLYVLQQKSSKSFLKTIIRSTFTSSYNHCTKGCILVIIFVMRIETAEMVLWDGIE